jgi:predicted Fe-S protein YdhL (DUF1289 family)
MSPASRLCQGCFRTLDEIAAWSAMSDDDKRLVWQQIERRAEKSAMQATQHISPGPSP